MKIITPFLNTVVNYVEKNGPETFEIKIAKYLYTRIQENFKFFENHIFEDISKEEFSAIYINQEDLKCHALIQKLEYSSVKNEKRELVRHFKSEVQKCIEIRDNSAGSRYGAVGRFLFSTFNSGENLVLTKLLEYDSLIFKYFENKYRIAQFKLNNPNYAITSNNIFVQNNYKNELNFNHSITYEEINKTVLQQKIDQIRKLHLNFKSDKISINAAAIVEIVFCKNEGLKLADIPKRKHRFTIIYGKDYDTIRKDIKDMFYNIYDQNLSSVAEALIFVSNNTQDEFTNKLQKEILYIYEFIREREREKQKNNKS